MRSSRNIRTRSVENIYLKERVSRQDRIHGDAGLVTSERVARLCGEHLEHAYEALRLSTHGTACVSCCFHQDMPNTIVCATSSNHIAMYDASRIMCLSQQPKGPRRCSTAFNPCLSHVAVYGDPMATAIELQFECGKFDFLDGHTAEVRCCVVSHKGDLVVSGGREGQAFLWHISQPASATAEAVHQRFRLPGHAPNSQVKACCISADSRWVATGGNDGNVLLWDVERLLNSDRPLPGTAVAAPVSAEEDDNAARVVTEYKLAALLQLPKGEQVSCLDLAGDGSWLAVGTRSGRVYVRAPGQLELQQLPQRHQEGSKVRCCAVSPDGTKLISTADDARLVLWDLNSSSPVLLVHEHFKPIKGCCWSPDGKRIATAGMDCLLCVMDIVLLSNQHRLRIATRLDTGVTSTGASSRESMNLATSSARPQVTGAETSAVLPRPDTASVPSHPMMTRTNVTEQGVKLLVCAPVLQLEVNSSSIAPAMRAGTAETAILCADQSGYVSMLLPGQCNAAVTGMSVGSGFSYCCFDGSILAAARRDGAVTVLSCNAAAGKAAAAALTGDPGGFGADDAINFNSSVAMSAKMDMLVYGISVNSQLGRVALVGTDKKQHQTGVMWLWEYDPSVRPAGLSDADDELRGVSNTDTLTRRASIQSGMLSSGESRIPSVGSPRLSGDLVHTTDEKHSSTHQSHCGVNAHTGSVVLRHRSCSHSGVTPAAAAIGTDAWLWHCGNPFKVLTIADTALATCAWAGGEHARLVVGSAAGWLAVVNMEGDELDQQMTRYQIHSCEVTAVDFASDGATVVSGSLDGRVVVWSHITGFKLAALTLHAAAIRTLAFSRDAAMLAIGDAAGIISTWDVVQGCLLAATQAHEGPVSSVKWAQTAGSSSNSFGGSHNSSNIVAGVVSCGYDGAVGVFQPDTSISRLYSAAFKGLYYSCKKSNKVHKLETALNWHLQQGVLQDPSVLQQLVMLAAADGNVAVLSLLLPLFDKMGWMLHLGPVWATASSTLGSTDSGKSLLGRRSFYPKSSTKQQQLNQAEDYVIHPHDRLADMSIIGALPGSRRSTKDAFKKPGHARNGSLGDGQISVDGAARNTRWTNSVADIRTILAFSLPQLQSQPSTQAHDFTTAAAGGAGAVPASTSMHRSKAAAAEDSVGSGCSQSPVASPASLTPTNLTPMRLLSPLQSRNARQPATLPPGLDTLHEESLTASLSNERLNTGSTAAPGDSLSSAGNSTPALSHGGMAAAPDDGSCNDCSTGNSRLVHLQRQGSGSISSAGEGCNSPLSTADQQRASSPFSQQREQELQCSPLRRMGSWGADSEQQHRQSKHQQSLGRTLIRFLSGRRKETLDPTAALTDSPDDSDSSPPTHLGFRQRSLSEGASLAQHLNVMGANGFANSNLGSSKHAGGVSRATLSNNAAAGSAAHVPGAVIAGSLWGQNSASLGAAYTGNRDTISPQPSQRRTTKDLLSMLAFGSSKRTTFSSRATADDVAIENGGARDLASAPSGFSAPSLKEDGIFGSARRQFMFGWPSWRNRGSKTSQCAQLQQPSAQQPAKTPEAQGAVQITKSKGRKDDLLQIAMASQQAQCVRLVVDALLEGRFSKASVVAHMYDALQALIHDQQHKRACRRLLKHLPMIELGEVEVDSLLTHNTKILYKCSAHGHSGNLWASATSGQQPLLDALDVLIKRASWRDSIVALIMWPALWGLRHVGAAWLWLWATQGLGARHRVQVSARSQLVPVARAAEIRSGSKGNLLRQLVSANVDADLYGKEVVRAIINVKWESFARAFLLMQGVQFIAFLVFFLAYLFVAVYGNDPTWTTAQMLSHPQGQAAVALESILMIMMFGQAADELKQVLTYGRDYFSSPWNYMDLASCCIIPILFLLHISRLNHQLFVILVALEMLLLCLRSLYFCMAIEQIGALLRMVLIVIRDMRYFFMMLIFLFISFGLTFSVLMSPASTARLNIVSLVGSNQIEAGSADVQVFGSLEDSITQLFTIMFGDVQFSTLKTIMNMNTVASRLAVVLACVYAVLVLIVLVNLLIAIVDETYGTVKESEADQMLRNKALIIDEIESTLADAVIQDLNSRVLLPYVHILVPQAARPDQYSRRRDLHAKFRKLKQFIKEHLPAEAAQSDAASAVQLTALSGSVLQQARATSWSTNGLQQAAGLYIGTHAIASGCQAARQGATGGGIATAADAEGQTDGGSSIGKEMVATSAAATSQIQQDIVQLSSSVSSINHQLEMVAGSSAAAVAELASKVEGLQGDIGQIKDLLLALLAKQQ